MNAVKLQNTPQNARDYLLDRVKSEVGVSSIVFQILLANIGKVQLLSNSEVDPIHSLDAGGICSKKESQKGLSIFFHERMQSENLACFFLNECAQKGEPGLDDEKSIHYVGTEVLHALEMGARPNDIYDTISDAETSLNPIGFLLPQEQSVSILQEKDITEEAIRICISGMRYLSMGVYDGECYLIWSRL